MNKSTNRIGWNWRFKTSKIAIVLLAITTSSTTMAHFPPPGSYNGDGAGEGDTTPAYTWCALVAKQQTAPQLTFSNIWGKLGTCISGSGVESASLCCELTLSGHTWIPSGNYAYTPMSSIPSTRGNWCMLAGGTTTPHCLCSGKVGCNYLWTN